MIKSQLATLVEAALKELGVAEKIDFSIDIPRRQGLGDYASNVALLGAKKLKTNPLALADKIAQAIEAKDKGKLIAKTEIAKPGFINFYLADQYVQAQILKIIEQKSDWGKGNQHKGENVILEFVSANPTGPLHVGHGRWAVIGDNIARLLSAVGKNVAKEYYLNDVGNQINKLIASIKAVEEGKPVPEGGYGGAYVKDLANKKIHVVDMLVKEQIKTLTDLGVNFNTWFKESRLHESKKVTAAIKQLTDKKYVYKEKGAVWFKSTEFGDDKDRVLIKENGDTTYFAADVAYHLDKFSRCPGGELIDIWGADHHGYVKRIESAMKALGKPEEKLKIIIGQLVSLYRGNEQIRMSKRTGEMVMLQEVVEEIGKDATRFFFSATDVNSHLDFDLELAKKRTSDNPVYYVQYAHARICSILSKSNKDSGTQNVDLSKLNHPAERKLILKLLSWPDLVEEAAASMHPHRLTEYGKELAAVFHSFYEKCKVLGNPARITLVDASRITLHNVLELLGISAPESM